MRRFGGFAAPGALVLALVACGSGQDPTVEGALSPTTTSTTAAVAVGDTATAVDPAAPAPAGDGPAETPAPTDPAPADPGGSGGGAGAAPFAPPAPGTYTFRTTGTTGQGLSRRQVDEQSVTTITALAADTVRQSSSAADMTQIVDLRYEAARVALLRLEVHAFGQTLVFNSPEGLTFVPVPPTPGQSWHGEMTDESGQLTATYDGVTQPTEVITVMGRSVEAFVIDATIHISGTYNGFPVDATVQLRGWLDPELRTQVRTHQVSSGALVSDTTSELVAVTPA